MQFLLHKNSEVTSDSMLNEKVNQTRKPYVCLLVALCVILLTSYIWFLGCLEGPIVIDITNNTIVDSSKDQVTWPWIVGLFLNAPTSVVNGIDTDGNRYTSYASTNFPDVFDGAELEVVISWKDNGVILYFGESRAMVAVNYDYPDVQWIYPRISE